jgi:PAS domain S-box-containing protein
MKKKVVPELFYKELMDNLYDGVYFVDTDRRITYWNKGAERLTDYQAERMIGSFCFDNLLNHVTETGKHLCQDGCPLTAALQNDRGVEAEVFLRHNDGHRVPVTVRVAEKLRTMIEHSTFMFEDCEVTITASIGATLVRESEAMKALIKRADVLMYQSKLNGRNRVTVG